MFEAAMRWALSSMFGHMVIFTLSVSVPMAIWLLYELHAASALRPITALVMLGLSLGTGLLTAYGMWILYFKSRRLPPR